MSVFGLGELICDICEFGDDPEDSRFGAVILYDLRVFSHSTLALV